MKQLSLPLLSALTALVLLAGSCKKAEEPNTSAIITGYDGSLCACCGGLMINFQGETRPYAGNFKLIDNGADVGLSNTEAFPLYVRVDYIALDKCAGKYIKITKLKRQ